MNATELAAAALFDRLKELGIAFETVEHAPLHTVAQSHTVRATIPGAHTKNLFLCDKSGRLALIIAKDDSKIDLKVLAKRLNFGRLSFAKPAQMQEVLGVMPGSVTAFALLHEGSARLSAVVVDETLLGFPDVNCHPLHNRATTRLATADLLRFMEACGHRPLILKLQ